jgi:WD40 repeat protein
VVAIGPIPPLIISCKFAELGADGKPAPHFAFTACSTARVDVSVCLRNSHYTGLSKRHVTDGLRLTGNGRCSPDGRLASGSEGRTIRLWDLTTGTESACLEGHTGSVFTLCVMPNGRLVSGSYDRTIRLWDRGQGGTTTPSETLTIALAGWQTEKARAEYQQSILQSARKPL